MRLPGITLLCQAARPEPVCVCSVARLGHSRGPAVTERMAFVALRPSEATKRRDEFVRAVARVVGIEGHAWDDELVDPVQHLRR